MRSEVNTIRKINPRVGNPHVGKPWAGFQSLFPAIKPHTWGTKKDIQVLRKLWHVIMMGSIALAYATVIPSKEFGLILIAVLGGPLVLLDILRLRWKELNRVAASLFGPFMRKRELGTFSGMGFFIIGLFIVVALFPKPLAILAILCL